MALHYPPGWRPGLRGNRRPARGTLVHAGSHSATERTNVSAVFSADGGTTWGNEAMVWESPLVGGYTAVQTWDDTVGVVFENHTCSISIGVLGYPQAL